MCNLRVWHEKNPHYLYVYHPRGIQHFNTQNIWRLLCVLPFRELTYLICGKGKSFWKVPLKGDMICLFRGWYVHYRFSSCTGSKQWWIVPLRAPDPQVCSAFLLFLLCLTVVWTPFSQLLLVRIKSMTMTWSATTTSTWLHASWRFGWVGLKIQGASQQRMKQQHSKIMCYSSFYSKSIETIEIMHCWKTWRLVYNFYTELQLPTVLLLLLFFSCVSISYFRFYLLFFMLLIFFVILCLLCFLASAFVISFVLYLFKRHHLWFFISLVSRFFFFLLSVSHYSYVLFFYLFYRVNQYLDIPRQLYLSTFGFGWKAGDKVLLLEQNQWVRVAQCLLSLRSTLQGTRTHLPPFPGSSENQRLKSAQKGGMGYVPRKGGI